MDWKTALVTGTLGIASWVFRRCLLKYERALVAAEKARRELLEGKLTELKQAIANLYSLHDADAKLRADLKVFLAKWAVQLKGDFNAQMKLHQGEVDELRAVLDGIVDFFRIGKDSHESEIKQIGKDTFLIHRKKDDSG